jgi:hypothetical protein
MLEWLAGIVTSEDVTGISYKYFLPRIDTD